MMYGQLDVTTSLMASFSAEQTAIYYVVDNATRVKCTVCGWDELQINSPPVVSLAGRVTVMCEPSLLTFVTTPNSAVLTAASNDDNHMPWFKIINALGNGDAEDN